MALAVVAFGVGSFFQGTQIQDYLQDKNGVPKQISQFLEEKSLALYMRIINGK